MKPGKIIAILILALLVLIVIMQNTAPVQTDILFISFQLPRALLLFITTLIGFILGLLVGLARNSKKKDISRT